MIAANTAENERRGISPMGIFSAVYRVLALLLIVSACVVGLLWLCGIRPYVVMSGSMEPTITTGSICVVNHNVSFDSISDGDVITYRLGDSALVTHRAVHHEAEGIITRGDANNTDDTIPVTRENYVGRVFFSIPAAGRAVARLQSRAGMISAAAFFAAFILAGLVLPDRRANSDSDTENKE